MRRSSSWKPGTAIRVLTGGMLPPGADTVVKVEDTDAPQGVAALPDRVVGPCRGDPWPQHPPPGQRHAAG